MPSDCRSVRSRRRNGICSCQVFDMGGGAAIIDRQIAIPMPFCHRGAHFGGTATGTRRARVFPEFIGSLYRPLSETILKTGRLDEMKSWYEAVLGVTPFF